MSMEPQNIVPDPILQNDLTQLAQTFPFAAELKDSSVLITGATGLVGSALARALAVISEKWALNIKIYALVRSIEKANAKFGESCGSIIPIQADVTCPLKLDIHVDHIFHTASVTASKAFVTQPVETLLTAITGTQNLLAFAREKNIKSMVYLSSMEAYGITDPKRSPIREADLGYIDILNVRSSYSEGKRICECLCSAYAAEYGVPVKIARLAQTFGAGVSLEDNRAFAQFTKACLSGQDIVLHTRGNSVGNYCYTTDAVSGLLTILLHGENAQAYTVVNERTAMPIRDVAQLVSDTLTGGKSKIVFDIPDSALTYGYAPDVTMHLSADKLRALGWEPVIDLPDMFRRLAASFQAQALS